MHLSNAQSKQRFALFDFFLVLISCIVLSVFPELGWIPLAIAFIPFVLRVIRKQLSNQINRFNFLIAFFLISSFVGILVAYNPNQAVHKFRLIICSVLLFFAISHQMKENLWIIITSLGFFGAITTVIFVVTNNWANFPADHQLINYLGNLFRFIELDVELGSFRNNQFFQANFVAGIIAILIPLNVVTTFHFWNYRNFFIFGLSLVILAFISFGLLLTSSRAAWVATFAGLVIFAALHNTNFRSFLISHNLIFLLIPVLIISFGFIGPIMLADSINNFTLSISGITSLESRVQLAKQTFFLITDFPFTGGGLGSFPGNYSQYILAIPFFMFGNSHNLYLDLWLEQGILGYIIWLLIFILCAFTIRSTVIKEHLSSDLQLLAFAIFSSLVIFLLHGTIDDPIYDNNWGISLLFLFPGLSIAISDPIEQISRSSKTLIMTGIVIFLILIFSIFLFQNQLLATWYANAGVINMAKIDLNNWPIGKWNEYEDLSVYGQAETAFLKSLSFQKDDFTANYRLGLVWMERRNFHEAIQYLKSAYTTNPKHRGIQKSLGYCYTWLGEFIEADLILREIPEAESEMDVYAWWWKNQGRDDLAKNASQMAFLLGTQ